MFSPLLLGSAVSSLPEQTICAMRTSVTAFLRKTLPSLQCPHSVEEPGGAEASMAAHGQLGPTQPAHPAAPAGTRAWQSRVTSWDGCGSMEQVVTCPAWACSKLRELMSEGQEGVGLVLDSHCQLDLLQDMEASVSV